MKTELIDIPGLFVGDDAHWKVKALKVHGMYSFAIDALDQWRTDPKMHRDYELIIEAIQLTANSADRIIDDRIVKVSENPDHGEVYEFRAYDYDARRAGKARLMFFYDKSEEALIICTNSYEKDKGDYHDQNRQFGRCDYFKKEYERNKP